MKKVKQVLLLVVILCTVQKTISIESSKGKEPVVSKKHPLRVISTNFKLSDEPFYFNPAKWYFLIENVSSSCRISLKFDNKIEEIFAYKLNPNTYRDVIVKDDLLLFDYEEDVFQILLFEKSIEEDGDSEKCQKLIQYNVARPDHEDKINTMILELFGSESNIINLEEIPLKFIRYPISEFNYQELNIHFNEIERKIAHPLLSTRCIENISRNSEEITAKTESFKPKMQVLLENIQGIFRDFCVRNDFVRRKALIKSFLVHQVHLEPDQVPFCLAARQLRVQPPKGVHPVFGRHQKRPVQPHRLLHEILRTLYEHPTPNQRSHHQGSHGLLL